MKHRLVVFGVMLALLCLGVSPAQAIPKPSAPSAGGATAAPSGAPAANDQAVNKAADKNGKKPDKKKLRITDRQRLDAAKRAAAQGLTVPATTTRSALAAADMAAPGSTPHYFGPYANYANSPLPTVAGSVVPVGNELKERAYATSTMTPPRTLDIVRKPLPDGLLESFQTFNQTVPGQSASTSAGKKFHAYVLRPDATVANQYGVVYDSGELTVPDPVADPVVTYPVPNVAVQQGDVIGYWGEGVPFDTTGGTDLTSVVVPAPPAQNGTLTLGAGGWAIYSQTRSYALSARVLDLSGVNQTVTGGIRKFVDTLPGTTEAGANNLGQYIPIAAPDKETYPGSDYYEIAVVQYQEKMHSDLPATTLRGYVQLSTDTIPGKRFPLTYPDGSPILVNGQPAYAVDKPHYLGPMVEATKNRPVRVLFRNLLPTGQAGDLFLPVDTSVMGSGMGPAMGGMAEPDPADPMCGQEPKPAGCYSENRATIHLHGGVTPWISDGTPHQWITPAGESTDYPKGVSVKNVPDMPDPGPGAQTFFYTNQQSARLMWYHDHSYGITRLNVYAGEAAPYLLTDDTEKKLVADGTIPGAAETMPLVVQDKTFVPEQGQLAMEDPTWDTRRWGGTGNLWTPHVYMPAQNPGDSSGVNAFGRWAYGPWFWPPTGAKNGPKPNPYYDPNCDSDVTGWCEPPQIPGTPNNSMGMEAFNDTPVVNGTAYPTVTVDPKSYRFKILNAANDRYWNLSLYQADASGTEVALNQAEVDAAQNDPTVFPTPDTAKSPAGPDWVQIGSEGGFLPTPAVIPAQPTTWVTDPTVFNAGNVDKHSLLLAPAERADTIVDFSKYAGKTLILYNDAPAAFPARDARYDYYTGNANLTATGGAPSTLPGYGPNTRTVMQIKVAAATPAPAFDLARLQTAFRATSKGGEGVFEKSQNPVVVGQGAYNEALGTSFRSTAPRDGFLRIHDRSLTFDTLSGKQLTMNTEGKAIQDEQGETFDPDYGRMSGSLGLEAPAAGGVAQNFQPYPYVNPATEILKGIDAPPGTEVTPISTTDDGTQLWRITHNGVDTHAIHFHMFDVQLVNRVGWDGIIRKPDPNELGWKDTVRMSPLEDTVVALRPVLPKSPFGVPDSIRPLNPAMPLGSTDGFVSTDPLGNPLPQIKNVMTNFGWEFVWHCHMLSHEEMDMMRPISVQVARARPATPIITYARDAGVHLTWTDGTPVGQDLGANWGSPAGEVGYRVERATVSNNGKVGTYATVGEALANQTTFTDASAGATQRYSYRVVAYNAAGDSATSPVLVGPAGVAAPAAPTNLQATLQSGPAIHLTWRDNASTETGFVVERAADGGAFVPVGTPPARNNTGSVSWDDTGVAPGVGYAYRVTAVNGGGASAPVTSAAVAVPTAPAAPTGLTATAVAAGKRADVTLAWADASADETGFEVQRATDAGFTRGLSTTTLAANAVTTTQTGLARGTAYYYRVRAVNLGGGSTWATATPLPITTP